MKKFLTLLIILALCAALGGCGKDPAREINAPKPSSGQSSPAPGQSADLSSAVPGQALPEGSIASLEALREKAEAAGYETGELLPEQKQFNDDLVGGFNVVIGSSHIPIMEYASPDAAQTNADEILAAGYNVPIINGRFLTFVSATKGVINDTQKQAALESLMDAKARADEAWSDAKDGVSATTTNYAEAYALMDSMRGAMQTLLDQAVTRNNNAHPGDDPQNTDSVIALVFGSIKMAFTSTLSEDEAARDAILPALDMMGMKGAKAVRNAAHDYTMTGTDARGGALVLSAVYDPASGALRMTAAVDGKHSEFFEFVPLGGDRYALQSDRERAVVTFRDGKLLSFTYTVSDKNTAYSQTGDGIYPSGGPVDESWAAPLGEDGYEQYFDYDGATIRLSVEFLGARTKVEISG